MRRSIISACSHLFLAAALALCGCGAGGSGGSTSTPPPPAPDFLLALGRNPAAVGQGGQVSATVTATPANGFSGNVTLSSSIPTGLSCVSSPCSGAATLSQPFTITLAAPSSTQAGAYYVTITGTSGSISHQVSLEVDVYKGDFTFSMSPSTANAHIASLTPVITLTMTQVGGFTGSLIKLQPTLPAGFTCVNTLCTQPSLLSAYIPLQFVVAPTVAPGSYTIGMTGLYGELIHQASVTVNITAPAPAKANSSGFVSTSPETSPPFRGIAYDKLHDLIFASLPHMNEVEVISPRSLSIIKHISVPRPVSLDLSLDNSTLYVGSGTQAFFEIDTSLQQVVKQVSLPEKVGGPNSQANQPSSIAWLADGTVMMMAGCVSSTQCSNVNVVVLYDPSTGSFTQPALPPETLGTYLTTLEPSPDHQHVFVVGMSELRYDLATHSFGAYVSPVAAPIAFAVKPDGSGLAAVQPNGQIAILDANFNLIATYSDSLYSPSSLVYSADGTRLYFSGKSLGYQADTATGVLDSGTLALKGYLSGVQPGLAFNTMDGNNHMLGLGTNGIGLMDMAQTPFILPASIPGVGSLFGGYAISPDHPTATGNATSIAVGRYFDTPMVTFNAVTAPSVAIQDAGTLNVTAPNFQGADLADVAAYFPDGTFLLIPEGYAYHPVIQYVDGDATGQDGNSTIDSFSRGSLTLAGIGFDQFDGHLSLSVGGRVANITSSFTLSSVQATVPAGTPGNADITLTTPIGSTTVTGGFLYVQRSDSALPSSAAPYQMILDKAHSHLLWTDQTANTLTVFSTSAGQVVQTINLGAEPAGLAITPDGSKILVCLLGANKLDIFDSATLNLLTQVNTPIGSSSAPGFTFQPQFVSAVAGGNAFLFPLVNGGRPILEYNISSNSWSERTDLGFQAPMLGNSETSSADGNTACIAGAIWTAESDRFVIPNDLIGQAVYALSADGAVLANYGGGPRLGSFYSRTGVFNGSLAQQEFQRSEIVLNALGYMKLNATGSLAFVPERDRIRIYDVRHGNLIKTLTVSGGMNQTPFDGLVVDPDGQALYALTNAGLTTFTFAAAPLSIGEVLTSGGQLTILGSGFAQGLTVKIDGTVIFATIQDSQHITATLPALSATSHNISVTFPSGTSYSLDNALTGSIANTISGTPVSSTSTASTP